MRFRRDLFKSTRLTSSSSNFFVFCSSSSLDFLDSSSSSVILSWRASFTVCSDLISSLKINISLLNWSSLTIKSSLRTFKACLVLIESFSPWLERCLRIKLNTLFEEVHCFLGLDLRLHESFLCFYIKVF